MSNKPSLAEQIKQRKHEEIRRGIQAKEIEKTKWPEDAPQSKPTAQPAAKVTWSQPVVPVQAPIAEKVVRAPFRSLNARQKTTLIAAGAAILILIVGVGTFAMASGTTSNASAAEITPTLAPLGTSSADALLQRYKDLGVVINDQKPYDLDNSQVWNATQAYTFNIKRDNAEASFLVLSYNNATDASNDMFDLMTTDKYKTWKTNIVGNVVLLAAPGGKSEIVNDMFSHMLTFLYTPYRLWPTATLLPTQTPIATAAATKVK